VGEVTVMVTNVRKPAMRQNLHANELAAGIDALPTGDYFCHAVCANFAELPLPLIIRLPDSPWCMIFTAENYQSKQGY